MRRGIRTETLEALILKDKRRKVSQARRLRMN